MIHERGGRAMAQARSVKRAGRLARLAPGLAALTRYDRRWLSKDVSVRDFGRGDRPAGRPRLRRSRGRARDHRHLLGDLPAVRLCAVRLLAAADRRAGRRHLPVGRRQSGAARGRRPGTVSGPAAGLHADDRRALSDRRRGQARLHRHLPVPADPDRLSERHRADHPRRPAAQAARLPERRPRVRAAAAGAGRASGPEPSADRPARPRRAGRALDPRPRRPGRAGRAGRRGRRHRGGRAARPAGAGGSRDRRAAGRSARIRISRCSSPPRTAACSTTPPRSC